MSKQNPIRIAIDLRALVVGVSGGIIPCLIGTFRKLFAMKESAEYFIYCTPFNYSIVSEWQGEVTIRTLPAPNFYANLGPALQEDRIDVLFRCYPNSEPFDFPLEKQIVFIPDIQHDFFPSFFSENDRNVRNQAFPLALNGASTIATISEFSKQTMLDIEYSKCWDIFLMSPAIQSEHDHVEESDVLPEELDLIPKGDFFFFPANLWKHKNHPRVLLAFKDFLEETNADVSLVLTGNPQGWETIGAQFSDIPVRHLGYVSPKLVRLVLQKAKALVFFSLFEGFGMPVLEAFAAGTPVICSNTTSLPEIAGDAALLANPVSIKEMTLAMKRIHQNEALRQDLVNKGHKRVSLFNWQKSANNLFAALASVAAGTRQKEPVLAIQEGAATDSIPALDTAREQAAQEPETPATMPRVGIVTPSFNQGRFIKRTIDSVFNQTYQNIEYIVVDGGSTDETIDVLLSYEGRLKWKSEPDNGQAHAINKGFATIDCDIGAYLNSDDILKPDAVEKIVRHFMKWPDLDMVYGHGEYIDEDDNVTGQYKTRPYTINDILEDCIICQPAAFWTRSIGNVIGEFSEDLRFAMDYDYWLRMAMFGACVDHIPDVLAQSRLYAETKTMSYRKEIFSEILKVSLKNTGTVHQHYFDDYWTHVCCERTALLKYTIGKVNWLMGLGANAHRLIYFFLNGRGWVHVKEKIRGFIHLSVI